MPQLIEHIDAIARKKQRDVLIVEFHNKTTGFRMDYRVNPARKIILDWFTANGIPYCECGPYASETRMESYRGQIYIDVPYDKSDPVFQNVASFLQNPDGSMSFEGAWFYKVSLDICMKNAHHDEPGFWDRWAGNF